MSHSEPSTEIEAVVYTSNTGHTKTYALMIGEEAGLPTLSLKDAKSKIDKQTRILYLGWLMAGQVKGYKDALKRFDVKAIVGVGMAQTGTQIEDIRKSNSIPDQIPVFSLQGGLEIDKLSGIYRMMMNTMKKTAGKGLESKANRTPEEEEMLNLLNNGGSKVSRDNLAEILNWVKG